MGLGASSGTQISPGPTSLTTALDSVPLKTVATEQTGRRTGSHISLTHHSHSLSVLLPTALPLRKGTSLHGIFLVTIQIKLSPQKT